MQGLGAAMSSKPMPQQQQAMPAGEAGEAGEMGGGMEQATPEEQAVYEDFIDRMQSILMPESGKVSGEIIANLRGDLDPQAAEVFAKAEPPLAQSPQDAVSATAVLLTLAVEGQAMQQGTDYPDEVVQAGGTEVIDMLAAVSEAAGIHEFEENELDGMYYRALDLYRVISPRADEASLKSAFGELVAANDAGKLNQVLPGLPGGPAMEKGAAA